MSAEIVPLRPGDVGDGYVVSADGVLEGAKGRVVSVAVIGITDDGQLYVAGSHGAEASYFLMARGQSFLLDNEVAR